MPNGEFSPPIMSALARSDAICAARGARLTDLRRQVLGLILDSEQPVGAYELLERLRRTRDNAAPPTVYRALDFLLEHGLIHKLERLSAFVGCVAHDHPGHQGDAHAAEFLICLSCKRVVEIEDNEIMQAMAEAAGRAGFSISRATIEAEGVCADCAATP